ncbi:MAG: IPTL-CTERM sorting domain-containing protein [Acidobacteriota bacterium]
MTLAPNFALALIRTAIASETASVILGIAVVAMTAVATPADAQPLAPPAIYTDGPPQEACVGSVEDGNVVLDDGSAETGYGWVPSVIEGEYVQRFSSSIFPTRVLESICVCWLRTRMDSAIDFEVVFYENDGGIPASTPYAVVPGSAEVEPQGIAETFTEVDVSGIGIPVGPSYIGVRWDASADQFFFVCADKSEGTEPVEFFFRDDRAEGEWTSVFDALDPIFEDHRALMIRGRSSFVTALDVPALGAGGLVALAVLLLGVGLRRLRRRN